MGDSVKLHIGSLMARAIAMGNSISKVAAKLKMVRFRL